MVLFSYINEWTRELECLVDAYEAAVGEVEALMDSLERETASDENWFERVQRDREVSSQLERALETADHLAQQVQAARDNLHETLETASIGLQLMAAPNAPSPGQLQASLPPTTILSDEHAFPAEIQRIPVTRRVTPKGWEKLEGEPEGVRVKSEQRGENAAPDEDAISLPLPSGTLILEGKYRIVQLLHGRPRLNLYLAQRLSNAGAQFPTSGDTAGEKRFGSSEAQHPPLVAIRELALGGLSAQVRQQIERAAFEEFVSPMLLGSPRLPGTGDRIHIENDRHYLIMQLRLARGQKPAIAITLAELLLRRQWPAWLNMETALEWGVQLSRIVARMHRLGAVLGDLNPTMVLVDARGVAEWAPVLLVSWPPAPQFWSTQEGASARELYTRIFPLAVQTPANVYSHSAFVAPETHAGKCDERSDVYSLGAILYLLLTHYAPIRAALRQRVGQENSAASAPERRVPPQHSSAQARHAAVEGITLIPPHLFNDAIPLDLETILLRALALDPAERYATAFELVEALEAAGLQDEQPVQYALPALSGERKAPKMTKVIAWLKHDSNA